jgi:lipopolysaccharide/colanic/teichoic acid biosynthesis glycosyltransferase
LSATVTREIKAARAKPNVYSRYGKRAIDLVGSVLGFVVLAPVFVLVASCILLASPGPVFFRQDRVGKSGRIFRIVKFRSMAVQTQSDSRCLPITVSGDRRITPVGRILRKYKIDELPQLWNVFLGEMSLVGPRPELPVYVNRYTPDQREVLSVRPGITDPASLLYRNEECLLSQSSEPERFYAETVLPDKLSINLQYIAKISFVSDMLLLFSTAKSVFNPSVSNGSC